MVNVNVLFYADCSHKHISTVKCVSHVSLLRRKEKMFRQPHINGVRSTRQIHCRFQLSDRPNRANAFDTHTIESQTVELEEKHTTATPEKQIREEKETHFDRLLLYEIDLDACYVCCAATYSSKTQWIMCMFVGFLY